MRDIKICNRENCGGTIMRIRRGLMENELVKKIIEILERKQECNVNCQKVFRNWVLQSESNDLFMEFSIIDKSIEINEINLTNKRRGTMTDILNVIKEYCKSITIVSVMTPEMYKFCDKNGFETNGDGFGFGTYVKRI